MATKKPLMIPLEDDGSLINWTSAKYPDPPDGKWRDKKFHRSGEWVENGEFDDVLKVVNIERGRSAAHFILEDGEKRKYVMFITDMLDAIQRAEIYQGTLAGTWTFCKRGQNYGIRLTKAAQEKK